MQWLHTPITPDIPSMSAGVMQLAIVARDFNLKETFLQAILGGI
jgi:hypothetical protein